MNIVFGSIKQTGQRVAEQQFDFASVKVEALGEAGTSRRVLFNRPACKLLDLEDGTNQEILFGFAQPEGEGSPRLFVVNTAEFTHEVESKTYKTSKNKSAYADSKERGKSISSRPLAAEITDFMGAVSHLDQDFTIELYSDEGEATVYELIPVVTTESTSDDIQAETTDAPTDEIEVTDASSEEYAQAEMAGEEEFVHMPDPAQEEVVDQASTW